MESYEQLLKEAYAKVKVVKISSERFEIPKAKGFISGKNTIITNITQISDYLRRPLEHIIKFLQQQLAVSGKMESDRLILNTKLNSEKINQKIQEYAKEYVLCTECSKPDTEITTEKGIKFKKCLACGAKSPVKS
ncbi:MAG: translation initiation factor IF-2 subunit beta [Candidatus Pacearchaeota archaeon]|nr:translation initiation factor IF-2 subunit beta [Candidatus Pacearchaeota archaeon]